MGELVHVVVNKPIYKFPEGGDFFQAAVEKSAGWATLPEDEVAIGFLSNSPHGCGPLRVGFFIAVVPNDVGILINHDVEAVRGVLEIKKD